MSEIRSHYTGVAIGLHWIIAVLLIAQIGLVMAGDAAQGPDARLFRDTHKAVGISLLVLTVLRIVWRFMNPPPPMPEAMKRWEKTLASATHWLFYAVLLILPLSGWLASSAAGRDISWFGLFNWPLLPIGGGREAAGQFMDVHRIVVKGLYVLAILHIGAALKHQFVDRDGVLGRMLPFLARR